MSRIYSTGAPSRESALAIIQLKSRERIWRGVGEDEWTGKVEDTSTMFYNIDLKKVIVLFLVMITYIYNAPIDTLGAYRIHVKLKTTLYVHAKHSTTDIIYIKLYLK